MIQFILEAPEGTDLVRAIIAFARSGAHSAVTALFASGMVNNVIFQNRLGQSPPYVSLPVDKRLLSLYGYYVSVPEDGYYWCFSAVTAYDSGYAVGGVVRSIVASGPVTVVLCVSENPSVFTLPLLSDYAAAGDHGVAENGSPMPAANGSMHENHGPPY